MHIITEDNRRWWILVSAALGLFLLFLDGSIVTVALPTIQRDLNASQTSLQWFANSYLVVWAVLTVIAGRLGDIYGRKLVFLIGLFVFGISSVLAGAAFSPWWLILWRAVQGAGAASMIGLSLAIATNAFPREEQSHAIAIGMMVAFLGQALGPLLGGILVTYVSWRWIFWINVPFIALVIAIVFAAVHESRDHTVPKDVDLLGLLTLGSGLAVLVIGLTQSHTWGVISTVLLIALSMVLLILFWHIDNRRTHPLIDLSLFRSKPYLGANLVGLAFAMSLWVIGFFQLQYLQNILNYTAFQAGLLFLPVPAMTVTLSLLSSRLVHRFGARLVTTLGVLLITGSFVIQLFITEQSGYGLLLPAFILFGIGAGLSFAPMAAAGMAALPPEKAGIASGVMAMNRIMSGALGIAIVGSLFQGLEHSKLTHLLAERGGFTLRPRHHELEGLLAGTDSARNAVNRLPFHLASQIHEIARTAFSYALAHSMIVMVAITAICAVSAWLLIPSRSGRTLSQSD